MYYQTQNTNNGQEATKHPNLWGKNSKNMTAHIYI